MANRDEVKELLNLIAEAEGTDAGRGYDEVIGYGKFLDTPKPLTEMTIAEVMAWQKEAVAAGAPSGAVGRYQIINAKKARTLSSVAREMGLNTSTTKFSPYVQDLMAVHLLERRGYEAWKGGRIDTTTFVHNLAKEWQGLPTVTGARPIGGKAGIQVAGLVGTLANMRAENQVAPTPAALPASRLALATAASDLAYSYLPAGKKDLMRVLGPRLSKSTISYAGQDTAKGTVYVGAGLTTRKVTTGQGSAFREAFSLGVDEGAALADRLALADAGVLPKAKTATAEQLKAIRAVPSTSVATFDASRLVGGTVQRAFDLASANVERYAPMLDRVGIKQRDVVAVMQRARAQGITPARALNMSTKELERLGLTVKADEDAMLAELGVKKNIIGFPDVKRNDPRHFLIWEVLANENVRTGDKAIATVQELARQGKLPPAKSLRPALAAPVPAAPIAREKPATFQTAFVTQTIKVRNPKYTPPDAATMPKGQVTSRGLVGAARRRRLGGETPIIPSVEPEFIEKQIVVKKQVPAAPVEKPKIMPQPLAVPAPVLKPPVTATPVERVSTSAAEMASRFTTESESAAASGGSYYIVNGAAVPLYAPSGKKRYTYGDYTESKSGGSLV